MGGDKMSGKDREDFFEDDDEYEEYMEELQEREEEVKEQEEILRERIREIAEELRVNVEERVENFKDKVEERKERELERLERERERMEAEREKMEDEMEQLNEKIESKIEKARKKEEKARMKAEKAREKAARINISVPSEMSEEWREWSDTLGSSVSELVRKSMKFVKQNIGDLEKLEEFGKKMESWGDNIEKAVEGFKIDDLGDDIKQSIRDIDLGDTEIKIKNVKEGARIKVNHNISSNPERIKKRVEGLIKLHKSIPIKKLAQTLNKSEEFAENLIYEVVALGVEGVLEEDIFKFDGDVDDVITVLFDLIDKK
jgi:DNA repair exonuclease SbcCD ATPase subunit